MAITIEQSPTTGVSVYNPVNFVVSSTNDAQTDFKYIADVYVTGTHRHQYKFPKNPTYDFGVINIQKVLESYISHDFDETLADNGIEQNSNSIISFQVVFGEEYTSGGTTVTTTGMTSGATLYGINSAINRNDWIDFTFTDYWNYNTNSTKFLTNQPDRTVPSDMNHWLYMANDGTTAGLNNFRIRTYDSAGTLNGSFNIANSFVGGSDDLADKHLRIPSGANINNISSGDVTVGSGALPILDADVYSYDIRSFSVTPAQTSEVKTFTRDFTTSCQNAFDLHFLNEMGGFDSFRFDKVHTKRWKKKQETYKTEDGTLGSGGAFTYSKTKHLRRPFYTETGETIVLRSNWITEDESVWLRELFDSPVIFMEDSDGNMFAITDINLTDYTERQKTIDKVFNLEIEVTYSHDNYRQRW